MTSTRTDLPRFRTGLARLQELFEPPARGEVFLPLPPGRRPEDARRHDLKLMAFHPLGTARADARPAHGVVDGDLRLHGVEGVYVADGSVVPSSLGVNPQLTIMALATRPLAHRDCGAAIRSPARRAPRSRTACDRLRVGDQVVAEHPLPVGVPLRGSCQPQGWLALAGKNAGSVARTLASWNF